MEARVGIEPTHKAFAEPCLTTWPPRRFCRKENSALLNQCKSGFASNAACKKGKSAAQALKPESQSAKLVILLKKFTPTTVLNVMPSHGTSHYSLCNDNRKTLRRKNQRRSEERRVGKECRSRWSPYH